jgi:hypothetical protein
MMQERNEMEKKMIERKKHASEPQANGKKIGRAVEDRELRNCEKSSLPQLSHTPCRRFLGH